MLLVSCCIQAGGYKGRQDERNLLVGSNLLLSEDLLSLSLYFSSLLFTLCNVRISLHAIYYFISYNQLLKSIEIFTVPLQQLCSVWLAALFSSWALNAPVELATRKWYPFSLCSIYLYWGCYPVLEIESLGCFASIGNPDELTFVFFVPFFSLFCCAGHLIICATTQNW